LQDTENYTIIIDSSGTKLKKLHSTAPMVAAATVIQIAGDFGHGRLREAGQMKEDDEGILFHTLLTAETHRGDRILRRKITVAVLFVMVAVCSWRRRCSWWWCWAGVASLQERGRQGAGAAHGLAGKQRRPGRQENGRRCFCSSPVLGGCGLSLWRRPVGRSGQGRSGTAGRG
jgi:hypothetical protein